MRCLRVRFLLTSVCFLLPFVAMTSTSEAGVIPWAFDVIFGPNYGPRGYASYGPRYYYGPSVTYGANYGWSGGGCCGTPTVAYRPAYGCCDPYPIACGPCGVPVAGNCGVATPVSPGASATSTPNNSNLGPARTGAGASKTFADDPANGPGGFKSPVNSGTVEPNSTEAPNPAREAAPGFKARPVPPATKSDTEEREAFKPPVSTDSEKPTVEDDKAKPKTPAATPKINDGDENGTEIKPASRTSQKIAWAPVLQRRQVSSQPQHGSAYIVRLPAYPKTNELRQPAAESTIAKK